MDSLTSHSVLAKFRPSAVVDQYVEEFPRVGARLRVAADLAAVAVGVAYLNTGNPKSVCAPKQRPITLASTFAERHLLQLQSRVLYHCTVSCTRCKLSKESQRNVGQLVGDNRMSTASAGDTQVVVYSYGVHYKWVKNLPSVVEDQLRAGNRLWNDLVALWRDYDEVQVPAVWEKYPEFNKAAAAQAAAAAVVKDLEERVAAEKVRQRTKNITGSLPAELAAARTVKSKATAALKLARDAAFLAGAGEEFKELNRARQRREYRDNYPKYCQDGVLYHATFDDIQRGGFQTALKAVADKRRRASGDGTWAQLRFHRFDGTGRMAVKLQGPDRTPAEIANTMTGRYRNLLAIPGWVPPEQWEGLTRAQRRHKGRVNARMRVGGAGAAGGGEVIEIPIQICRMLPADAEIVKARLVIKQVGSQRRASLDVTARIPAQHRPGSQLPTVAVHLGWRREDGGRRVATWQATGPIQIPDALREIVVSAADGTAGKVVVPDLWFDRGSALNKARGMRRDNLNAAATELVRWLDDHGPVTPPQSIDPVTGQARTHSVFVDRDGEDQLVTAGMVRRWVSPTRSGDIPVSATRKFAVLARCWTQTPPTGADGTDGQQIAQVLESWRSADRKDWDRDGFGTRRLTNHRKDIYAQVANVFAAQAGILLVDDMSVARLKGRAAHDEDLPNAVVAEIGRQRDLTAPGLFRELLAHAGTREGVTLMSVAAKDLSRKHAACGHINDVSLLRGHDVDCVGCGARYDIDWNATAIMLETASEDG